MNQAEAIQQMINYLDLANRRGAFNLKESQSIANAIDAFAPRQEAPKEPPQNLPEKPEPKTQQ